YPRASQLAEETGTVRVRIQVNAAGQFVGAQVVKSSGFKGLDRATVQAFSNCKFNAALQDGKPVDGQFDADYVWKLDE
ncbi:energy transducer TonB, partial [Acinetobacter baumannii]